MAGFIGCVPLVNFFPLHSQLTPDTSLVVWHEGHTTAKFMRLPHLSRAKFHSDIVLIQSLDPNTVPVKFAKGQHISLPRRALFHPDDKLLISDCQHAEAFQWRDINLKYTYQGDSEIGFLDKIIYYIGDTGRSTHEGKPIHALYRRNLNKSLHNPIELVEEVENMSIRFGIKNGLNDNIIYVSPDQIKRGSDVRSLEVTLLFNERKSLQREWRHIIALREREPRLC